MPDLPAPCLMRGSGIFSPLSEGTPPFVPLSDGTPPCAPLNEGGRGELSFPQIRNAVHFRLYGRNDKIQVFQESLRAVAQKKYVILGDTSKGGDRVSSLKVTEMLSLRELVSFMAPAPIKSSAGSGTETLNQQE